MNLGNVFRKTGILSSIKRFNNIYCTNGQNVAEHVFFVTFYSLLISDRLQQNRIKNIDKEEMIRIALFHDIEEVVSGDFPHSAKIKYPELGDTIDKLGEDVVKDIFENDIDYINSWISSRNCNTVEEKIVRFSDWISVYLYAEKEFRMGNSYMSEILDRQLIAINKFVDENKEFTEIWKEISE